MFCITTFGTIDPYTAAAAKLKESCDFHDVTCLVQDWPHDDRCTMERGRNPELWHQKGDAVLKMLNSKQMPMWWVDADALLIDGDRLKWDTIRLIRDNIDFACHMFGSMEKHSPKIEKIFGGRTHWPAGGALFFNDTAKARELIANWKRMHELFPLENDQLTLEHAMKSTVGLTTRTLPAEYYQMFDHKTDKKPVFRQMQVFRNPGYLS